jgi:hypothetical protein
MRKTFIPIGLGMFMALGALLPNESYAQAATKSKTEATTTEVADSVALKGKEVKNRNEMLSGSPSMPRQINTGIPPGGDILIMENDVPVIFTFYPQIVTSAWKYDSSIGKIGLLSLAEGALTFGKSGFTLTTGDRQAGPKFKGFFSAYVNSWGSLNYSGNISGPMGKKGWGYTFSMHETYERGNGMNLMYYPYSQRMEMFKAGINKRYKNGNVSILFKHASAVDFFSNNQPLKYNGKGSFSEYPGFTLNQDSYTLGNGAIAYADANTGKSVPYNLGDDKFNKKISNAIYLNGEHKFGKGYRLTYASMYMHSKAPFTVQFPLTLGVSTPNSVNQYFLHGSSTAYTDPVQQVIVQAMEPVDIDQSLTRIELLKKFGTHNLRLAMTEQYYATGLMQNNQALYYQTVTANPKLLDWKMSIPGAGTFPITNSDGILPIPGSISKYKTNRTALYFSDDFTVGKMFDFTVGARIEKQDDRDVHDQYANSFVKDRPLMTTNFKNKWNHVIVGSFVAKVTHDFGFLGDLTYNDYFNKFYDYPESQKDALGQAITTKDAAGYPIAQTTEVKENQMKVLFVGAGIYYNHGDKFSIVSKVTNSSKLNNVTSMSVFNPTNSSQTMVINPVFYDISTTGWTTDIMTSPFKNFNLHYLITLQNPKYANYSVTAFGTKYSYNNAVPALSKVLMEIDPSYKLGDFRLWAGLRYFGKQYGNLTNSIYYNAWWENFAGVDFRLSRNCDMKLQITNFLNQKGISGALQGADQITAATEPNYIGKTVTAYGIRPRTIEFTVNFKL